MQDDGFNILNISAALASVSGTLSAIAFAFLQMSEAARLNWGHELELKKRSLTRVLYGITLFFRGYGINAEMDGNMKSIREIECIIKNSIKECISIMDEAVGAGFTPSPDETVTSSITRAVGLLPANCREAARPLVAYFTPALLDGIQASNEAIELLGSSIAKARRREQQLHEMVCLSGGSLLVFCAAAVPKISIEINQLALYVGMALIYGFYAAIYVEIGRQSLAEPKGGGLLKSINIASVFNAVIFIVAYAIFVFRASGMM